uniref:Trafficking protein particle complex subunit 12-like n=1 Tax=Hirondellea gigas TaxID=1518452 RepID=A0A6A7G391_9CRUS
MADNPVSSMTSTIESSNLETATTMFQKTSLNDAANSSVAARDAGVSSSSSLPIGVASVAKSSPSAGSTASSNKLKQYFSNSPQLEQPFDSIASFSSNTATMNPAYMSPTDAFGIPSPDSFLTPATEQDVFTASLLSSDADRRHDAWIPADITVKALKAMESNPPGIYFPEKDLLTMPGIAIKEDFGDPIKSLLRTYVGEEAASKRQVLNSSSVTQDDRGLRQLIAAGCYHAAVNLTTQLLTVYGQGEGRAGHPSKHTAHSIQLWFTRLALLVKLRRYSLAEVECEQFGQLDAPDLYFEFYPELYGGRRGSMVPFSFRLLVAELPHYLGKHSTSLDRLNSLLHTCHKIVGNLRAGLSECGEPADQLNAPMKDDSVKLWRNRTVRVMYSLTAVAASLKDYRLCGSLLHALLQEDRPSCPGLYAALGRLHLHLGDIPAAQSCFNRYLEVSPSPPRHSPVQGLLHSAYIAMAGNHFSEAVDTLQQALQHSPANPLVISNLGVSLVYTGRIRDAVSVVEAAVYAEPERMLHESLVLNLATMYELESCNASANKIKLLELVAQHKGDSFAVAALKLH